MWVLGVEPGVSGRAIRTLLLGPPASTLHLPDSLLSFNEKPIIMQMHSRSLRRIKQCLGVCLHSFHFLFFKDGTTHRATFPSGALIAALLPITATSGLQHPCCRDTTPIHLACVP